MYNHLRTVMLRIIVFVLAGSLVLGPSVVYSQPAPILGLPKPGTMIDLSPAYVPVSIKGLKIRADNPLAMDFIVDTGNSGLKVDRPQDKQIIAQESQKLIKYFLAALTLPEKDVWVNLSPYEKDRIIPLELGQTEMGRDMLAEDYILKQITASLIYPEKTIGKKFWNRVYQEAEGRFGTTNIPVNTFNKVWIVADKATVYENKHVALVVDAHLKVMLEEDYLAMNRHSERSEESKGTLRSFAKAQDDRLHSLGSQIVRSIVLPALEKEVNNGNNFANLRQIFHSLILAKWYKESLKQALINQVYSNQNKVAGVDLRDKTIVPKIYQQYLRAYKKGVFNFIKEDIDQTTQQPLPRKYFSGGVVGDMAMATTHDRKQGVDAAHSEGNGELVLVAAAMNPAVEDQDAAMAATSWTRKSYPENTYTIFSGTNATVIIDDEKDTFRDVHIHNWDKIDTAAREFLRDQKLGSELKVQSVQVKVGNKKLPFGYAIDHDRDIIYLTEEFYSRLLRESPGDNFDFFVRKLIFLLFPDPLEGQKFEYQYAYEKYTDGVKNLFPSDSEPTELLGAIRKANLFEGIHGEDESGYLNLTQKILHVPLENLNFLREFANPETTFLGNNQMEITADGSIQVKAPKKHWLVVPPEKQAKKANHDVLDKAKHALYIIGLNALDGIVNYKENPPQSTGQFSSKFNPITIAQSAITVLYTYAISAVAGYKVNVSEVDPRKRDVFKSFKARMKLAVTEIQSFFHNLVTILDSDSEIRKWNGEEVAVIRASKIHMPEGEQYRYVYTSGGDHFYVWAPFDADNNKVPHLIGFDDVTGESAQDGIKMHVRDYYAFYAGLGDGKRYGMNWKRYQDLVKRQSTMESPDASGQRKFYFNEEQQRFLTEENLRQLSEDQKKQVTPEMMEKRKAVIEAILAAQSEEDMQKIFENATILPRLDTVGKMVLARKALPQIDFTIAHTIRKGANFGDNVRDLLIKTHEVSVFNVDGLDAEVAATRTREGLIAVLYGIINFNLLYGASKPTLQAIWDPADRKPLEVLLRQKSLVLPKSISNMLFDKESVHMELLTALHRALRAVFPDIPIRISEFNTSFSLKDEKIDEKGKAVLEIHVDSKLIFRIEYQIENTINKDGGPANLLMKPIIVNYAGEKSQDIQNLVLGYIRRYNEVPPDAAMVITRPEVSELSSETPTGGIDLNANRMQLNVQKQGAGAGIHFDPAMIQQFKNGDFQGFVPIIISIRPVVNITSLLELNQAR